MSPLIEGKSKNTKDRRGKSVMQFIGILVVMLAFLTAIFTAGYEDRPNKNIK